MTRTPMTTANRLGVAALAFVLASCGGAPMPMGPRTPSAPVAAVPSIAPSDVAGAAERACIAAGQERGLQVIGIAGARDVVGPSGTMMRDVMLRVSRGGAQIEVRCNYQPDDGLARIMLI